MTEQIHRYVRMTGLAAGAAMRVARFEDRDHLVVPVVMMVGGSVVHPMGSTGGELVPLEVLARAPKGWDGRPVVPEHPTANGEPVSANTPATLERERFGTIFNARVRRGRLVADAWLDLARAEDMGGDPLRVVDRLRAGEDVEVSVGAYITLEERSGRNSAGEPFTHVWIEINGQDHLAMLTDGAEGACSVEMGCGAPRAASLRAAAKEAQLMSTRTTSALRAAVRSRARRPTFSGTESTAWSAPTFSDYIRAYFDGDDPPSSVAEAPAALRGVIASRTLLGDPDADNFRDLSFFPVVNPSTDKLNERALRAVLGGRGSQADIPEAARESAQAVARRLLSSEFGADLEASSKEVRMTARGLINHVLEALGLRGAQDADTSVSELHGNLWEVLRSLEPAFEGIVEIFLDSSTVVYAVSPDGQVEIFRRAFSVSDDGEVSVGEDREEVTMRTEFVPAEGGGCVAGDTADADAGGEDPKDAYDEKLTQLRRAVADLDALVAGDADGLRGLDRVTRRLLLDNRELLGLTEEQIAVTATGNDALPCGCAGECGCGHEKKIGKRGAARKVVTKGDGTKPRPRKEASIMALSKNQKGLIERLVAMEGAPFDEDDTETLSAMSEGQLESLAELYHEKEEVELLFNDRVKRNAKTVDEWVEDAPEEVAAMFRKYQAEEDERREDLVISIARATTAYSKSELRDRGVDELEKLAKALRISKARKDYSGQGLPVDRSREHEVPPPPNQAAYIRARADGKNRHDAMREAHGEARELEN